jgi:predicted esterase
MTKLLVILCLLINLSGCAGDLLKQQNPRENAERIASKAELTKALIPTKSFTFTSYNKIKTPTEPLTIYIEGDGRSWITRTQVSSDPTPYNPLALKLASLDPSQNVAYLARPCQYTPHEMDPFCQREVWTNLRFSEHVVNAMNEAIEQLKDKAKAKKLHLVGFSGGAGIAILIAARRNDIASIRTVAGDLDHVSLTAFHKTTPLLGSLNPKAIAHQLNKIPQLHFSGSKDSVVPPFIAEGFVQEVIKSGSNCARCTTLNGFTHHEGWEKSWPVLLTVPF